MSDEWYKEISVSCFRLFGFTTLEQVDNMTLREYEWLNEAAILREIDADYRNHLQAFLNFIVQAKKKNGKYKEVPVYKTFHSFYDYKKELKKAKKSDRKTHDRRFDGIGKLIKKQKGG